MCYPIIFHFTNTNKFGLPIQNYLPLRAFLGTYCGAGGIRTLVQTRNHCAFYALIFLLFVGLVQAKKPANTSRICYYAIRSAAYLISTGHLMMPLLLPQPDGAAGNDNDYANLRLGSHGVVIFASYFVR